MKVYTPPLKKNPKRENLFNLDLRICWKLPKKSFCPLPWVSFRKFQLVKVNEAVNVRREENIAEVTNCRQLFEFLCSPQKTKEEDITFFQHFICISQCIALVQTFLQLLTLSTLLAKIGILCLKSLCQCVPKGV